MGSYNYLNKIQLKTANYFTINFHLNSPKKINR